MADKILPQDRPIVTRAEAKALGLKRWFTGKPCLRGHWSERSGNGNCLECHTSPERKARRIQLRCQDPLNAKAKTAKYNRENADKKRASAAAYREKNRDKLHLYGAEYSRRNRDKYSAKAVQKYWEDPIAGRNKAASKRVRKLQRNGEATTAEVRALLIKQNHRCGWCGRSIRNTKKDLDHITPISKGGLHIIRNLIWACQNCNRRKNNKDPIVFAQENGLLI